MITTIIKNPGRTLAFLVGATMGSQVPYFPTAYGTHLNVQKENAEDQLTEYKEILDPTFLKKLEKKLFKGDDNSDRSTIQKLYDQKNEQVVEIKKKIQDYENSSLIGKLRTITLDPKGSYRTINHYHLGFDPYAWKETGISALVGGIFLLGVYEFLIKRPLKKRFSRSITKTK